MTRIASVILLILMVVPLIPSTKTIETDHLKPFRIRVDKNRIIISEGPQISVYSKDTFKLLSRFGKAGEGPGEFKLLPEFGPEIDIRTGKVVATSMGKITLISFDGKLISEKNTAELGRVELFRPLGSKFLGNAFKFEDKKIWNVINLYDEKLKVPVTIHKIPFHMVRGEPFNPITRGLYLPNFYVSGNIIWAGGTLYRGNILAYDGTGKFIRDITPMIEKVKFTARDKQGWIDSYMTNADYRLEYERLKKRFRYPEYFPFWQNFIAVNGRIYLQTFARNDKEGTNKFYIYDFTGKQLKTLWLPLTEYYDFTPDPYYIYGDKLYQLSNNYDEETIELKVTDIQ